MQRLETQFNNWVRGQCRRSLKKNERTWGKLPLLHYDCKLTLFPRLRLQRCSFSWASREGIRQHVVHEDVRASSSLACSRRLWDAPGLRNSIRASSTNSCASLCPKSRSPQRIPPRLCCSRLWAFSQQSKQNVISIISSSTKPDERPALIYTER